MRAAVDLSSLSQALQSLDDDATSLTLAPTELRYPLDSIDTNLPPIDTNLPLTKRGSKRPFQVAECTAQELDESTEAHLEKRSKDSLHVS